MLNNNQTAKQNFIALWTDRVFSADNTAPFWIIIRSAITVSDLNQTN